MLEGNSAVCRPWSQGMSLRAMLGTAPKDLAPAVALEASRLVLLGTRADDGWWISGLVIFNDFNISMETMADGNT